MRLNPSLVDDTPRTMAFRKVLEQSVSRVLAKTHDDAQRAWEATDSGLQALCRGRVEATADTLLELGLITKEEAAGLRSGVAISLRTAVR
jgi:hypothetical protein